MGIDRIMIDTVLTILETGLHVLGLPVLFVIFVLKGALVGKILPTSIVLPGYVISTGGNSHHVLVILLVTTGAHLIGQLVVFEGVRRFGQAAWSSRVSMRSSEETNRENRVGRWFDEYGDLAVVGSNLLPWTRGLIAIPAAAARYPARRYFTVITVSNICYHGLYIGGAMIGLDLVVTQYS